MLSRRTGYRPDSPRSRRARRKPSRELRVERLESRVVLDAGSAASPWQNPLDAMDANLDGAVDLRDGVALLRSLARYGADEFRDIMASPLLPEELAGDLDLFLDVNGDATFGLKDAVALLRDLKTFGVRPAGSAEGEYSDDHVDVPGPDATLIELSDDEFGAFGVGLGRLHDANDVDVFQLATQGGRLAVAALSYDGADQLLVSIVDASGAVLVSTGDGESALDFCPGVLDLPVADGGLYYVVVSAAGSEVSEYALGILQYDPLQWLPAPDATLGDDLHADELGDAATWLALESGSTTVVSHVDEPGDVDVFRVDVQAGTLSAILSTLDGTALPLQIHSADGELLAETAGETWGSVVELPVTPGSYFVSVGLADGQYAGLYLLEVFFLAAESWRPTPDSLFGDDPHGDVVDTTATVLTLDPSLHMVFRSSYVDDNSDVDVFQVIPGEDTLLVSIFAWEDGLVPTVEVVDAAGQSVAGIDWSIDLLNRSGLLWIGEVVAGDTYYVIVAGDGGHTGQYLLAIAQPGIGFPL